MRLRGLVVLIAGGLLAGCAADVSGPNRPPVARAGADQVTTVFGLVDLDGSASWDPDGDELTYDWKLVAAPTGGAGTLVFDEALATLTPDAAGHWLVALQVYDGTISSARDVVRVTVRAACQTDADCPAPGDWCAGDAVCDQGGCRVEPRDCADANPCTQDLCDETADACDHPPVVPPPGPEGTDHPGTCTDGLDNDCDGALDVADPDCGVACAFDADCDDANPCTAHTCTSLGTCDYPVVADGTACDDGVYCTEGDTCQTGVCTPGPDRNCSDGDPCTQDLCDEALDTCDNPDLVDPPGDEGLNFAGSCTDGRDNDCDGLTDGGDPACIADCVADSECDDLEPCTTDSCNGAGRCDNLPMPDSAPCDDGLACIENETCQSGQCMGTALVCSGLSDQCNLGQCDEAAFGCVAQPAFQGDPCVDGLACTQGQTCQAGACAGGTPLDCSGLTDPCNLGTCDEGAGGCVAQPTNEGGGCDDGLACNQGETCQSGVCTGGSALDCSGFTDDCNLGACDEGAGGCVAQPANEGQPCDDGLWCTDPDSCQTGACVGGPALDCTAFTDACNQGICDEPAMGCTLAPIPDGTECGTRFCTGTDLMRQACLDGACSDSALVSACDDGDTCSGLETCDPVAGCQGGPSPGDGTSCTPPPGPVIEPCDYQCLGGTCSEPPYARPAQLCDPADPRLGGCWTFDGDGAVGSAGGVIDDSGNSAHGTASNVTYVGGIDNSGVAFAAVGEIHVPDNASLNCSESMTMEAWIYPDSLPAASRTGIVDKEGQYGLFLYDQNRIRCFANEAHFATSPPPGQWSHVACVFDGPNDLAEIYIDGQPVYSAPWTTNIPTGSGVDFTIGSNSPNGQSFDGQIDSVRLWCQPLSADELCWAEVR